MYIFRLKYLFFGIACALPPHFCTLKRNSLTNLRSVRLLSITCPRQSMETVADTNGDGPPQSVVVETNLVIHVVDTDAGTPVNRQLEGEPEIILEADMSGSTRIEPVLRGIVLENISGTTTDTHIPMPFTLLVPRESGSEGVNPIVGDMSTQAEASGERRNGRNHIGCHIKHIGRAKTMLIRERCPRADVNTNGTRLRPSRNNATQHKDRNKN